MLSFLMPKPPVPAVPRESVMESNSGMPPNNRRKISMIVRTM